MAGAIALVFNVVYVGILRKGMRDFFVLSLKLKILKRWKSPGKIIVRKRLFRIIFVKNVSKRSIQPKKVCLKLYQIFS